MAVATWVTSMAIPAVTSAASWLPALNPNQPTQSMAAPVTHMVTLWGGMGVLGNPLRLPTMMQATRAATPALIWTTVPPAKSMAPHRLRSPPPHTMWQMGADTTVTQMPVKIRTAENFIRSAKAPTTRAGVMMAKVN